MAAMACPVPATLAQLPTARLDAVFPPGLQAGRESELTLTGQDLQDVDRLLFSDAGLSAVPGGGLKFKVTASAGMAPGLYEIRAAGRYGISASRLFEVGTLPEVSDPGNNDAPDKALVLTLPVTVNGTTGADAADFFRFTATKGDRLRLSCAAQRIDSPLNAVLTLSDATGRELTTAHRTHHCDPVIDFTAPHDGDFIVKLHDIVWQAGPACVYRFTAAPQGMGPAAESPAMPLPGALCDWMPAQPVTEFKEPAASAAAPHKLSLPAVVSPAPGRQDWFEFTGEKDRRVMIDVLSHRRGQPSDWVLQVFRITRDEKGQEKSERVAEFDDTAAPPGSEGLLLASRDPSGSITCAEHATYRIHATDRYHARQPWQLVLRDPQPGFSVVATSVCPASRAAAMHRWSPLLRKGGSALLQAAVLRRDGFDAPVTLRLEGLPAGVSTHEVTVPAGVATAVFVVRAGPDAKTWSGRIKITGTSGDTTVTAREAIPRWTVGNSAAERLDMRLSSDGFVLAVNDSEAAPLTVEAAESKVYETALAGSIEVPVKFIRDASHKGFKGEWEAVLMGMPGLRTAPIVKPAADAADAKLVLDLKRKDGNVFIPGTWTFHASARGTVKRQPGEKDPVVELVDEAYSGPIQIRIEPSPVLLTAPAVVPVAPGAKVEVPLKLERRYGFAEAATVELTLPAGLKGLAAAKLSVPKEAGEAMLIVEAAADAPPGTHACTLAAKCSWNGEELPWSIPLNIEVKP